MRSIKARGRSLRKQSGSFSRSEVNERIVLPISDLTDPIINGDALSRLPSISDDSDLVDYFNKCPTLSAQEKLAATTWMYLIRSRPGLKEKLYRVNLFLGESWECAKHPIIKKYGYNEDYNTNPRFHYNYGPWPAVGDAEPHNLEFNEAAGSWPNGYTKGVGLRVGSGWIDTGMKYWDMPHGASKNWYWGVTVNPIFTDLSNTTKGMCGPAMGIRGAQRGRLRGGPGEGAPDSFERGLVFSSWLRPNFDGPVGNQTWTKYVWNTYSVAKNLDHGGSPRHAAELIQFMWEGNECYYDLLLEETPSIVRDIGTNVYVTGGSASPNSQCQNYTFDSCNKQLFFNGEIGRIPTKFDHGYDCAAGNNPYLGQAAARTTAESNPNKDYDGRAGGSEGDCQCNIECSHSAEALLEKSMQYANPPSAYYSTIFIGTMPRIRRIGGQNKWDTWTRGRSDGGKIGQRVKTFNIGSYNWETTHDSGQISDGTNNANNFNGTMLGYVIGSNLGTDAIGNADTRALYKANYYLNKILGRGW